MGVVTAATAIIHFVGLCVFTTQTSSPVATSKAAAPAYAREAQGRPIQAASYHVAVLPRIGPSSGIDPHTALVAFRQSQLLFATGWQPKLLRGDGPYAQDHLMYVELNGDQVRFIANGANGPSLTGFPLTLPSLKNLYHKPSLLTDYTPASSYAKAAAVFDIPVGALNACSAGEDYSRFDTLLNLNSDCVLIVASGTKSLVLRVRDNDDSVLVENVPLAYAQGNATGSTSVPHYHVYCEMVGADAGTCGTTVFPKATDSHLVTSTNSTAPIAQCVYNAMSGYRQTGTPGRGASSAKGALAQGGPPPQPAAANFECSNSQWP